MANYATSKEIVLRCLLTVAADAEGYRGLIKPFVQGQPPIPWHLTHHSYSALCSMIISNPHGKHN